MLYAAIPKKLGVSLIVDTDLRVEIIIVLDYSLIIEVI